MIRRPLKSRDGLVSGTLIARSASDLSGPLLVAIHGGGCNSRYFEIGARCLGQAAPAGGWPLLLLDRPGHGGNAAQGGASPVSRSTRPIRAFVEEVRAEQLPRSESLALLGHSVGGAVAAMLGVSEPGWPLRGIAISGIGDVPTPAVMHWCAAQQAGGAAEPDASLFFGVHGTYPWRNTIALRRSNEPWQPQEVTEIVCDWPSRFPEVAARVNVPVHLRLADQEKIWQSGRKAIERIAKMFVAAPSTDAAILPDGGHLYEVHHRGPELIASQLEFLRACVSAV